MSENRNAKVNNEMKNNGKCDGYSELFTAEYLMGPNSMRLLDEMLEKYPLRKGSKVMDLGCGKGITSLYLAKEAGVNVFATDLWISATENQEHFKEWGVQEQVIPIHANADDLPYAKEYFDAVVTIDSYHYFAYQRGYFQEKILPFVKKGGVIIIAIPGVREKLQGSAAQQLMEWVGNDQHEYDLFQTRSWWVDLIGKSDEFEIIQDFDLDCYEQAWEDWFASGHEYARRDEVYFRQEIGKHMNFVGMIIRKNGEESIMTEYSERGQNEY